jgi:hypothetical protein
MRRCGAASESLLCAVEAGQSRDRAATRGLVACWRGLGRGRCVWSVPGTRGKGDGGDGSDPPPPPCPTAVLPSQDFVPSREMTLFLIDAGPSMLEQCDLPEEEVRSVCCCLFVGAGCWVLCRIGGLAPLPAAAQPSSLQAFSRIPAGCDTPVPACCHMPHFQRTTTPPCPLLLTPLAHPARLPGCLPAWLQAFAGMTWLEVAVRVAAEIMRQKIIALSGDQIGVALYGTVSGARGGEESARWGGLAGCLAARQCLWCHWRKPLKRRIPAAQPTPVDRCSLPALPCPAPLAPPRLTLAHLQREQSMQAAGAGGSFNLTWLLQEMELPGADALSKLEGFNCEQRVQQQSGLGARGWGLGSGWTGLGGKAGRGGEGSARYTEWAAAAGPAVGADFADSQLECPAWAALSAPAPLLHTFSHPSHPSAPPPSAVEDFHRNIGSAKPDEMGTALQRAFWLAKSVCDAAKVGWGLGCVEAWGPGAGPWGDAWQAAAAGLSWAWIWISVGHKCVASASLAPSQLPPWQTQPTTPLGRPVSLQCLPDSLHSHSPPLPAAVQQCSAHPAVHPQP